MYSRIEFLPSSIEEICILTKVGIPLVGFCRKQISNYLLAGKIMTSLRRITMEMSCGDLQSFSMLDSKFISIPCNENDVVIFCKCPLKTKEKKILKTCQVISKMFTNNTKNLDFTQWQGDVSLFDDFKKHLELYFKMSNL